ncbi:TPA: hypothetical protein HA316_06055 [Candidatus Micrarchaeota archaeon]|nr:hypothetical protein [Candidatus Micrarchaeota archaeon]
MAMMDARRAEFDWAGEDFDKLPEKFQGLGFSECEARAGLVRLKTILSRDLNNKAYRWIGFEFTPKKVAMECAAGNAADRVAAAKMLLAIAELCPGMAKEQIYMYVAGELEMFAKIDRNTLELAHELDLSERELSEARLQAQRLAGQIEKVMGELARERERNTALASRIKNLEGMGTELLEEEIIHHLEMNNGEIDVCKFAAGRKLAPARVGEMLDSLSKQGAVERIG